MTTGIIPLCTKFKLSTIQMAFQIRAGHTGLYSNGLIRFIKVQDLVEVASHIQGYAALYRFYATGNGRTAAVNIQWNFLFGTVSNGLFNLFRSGWINNQIRQAVPLMFPDTIQVIGSLTKGNRQAVIIGLGPLIPINALKEFQIFFCHLWSIIRSKVNGIKTRITNKVSYVFVMQINPVFHHVVKAFFREFEMFRVTPTENGTIGICRSRCFNPLWLKAVIRFVSHN